METQRLLMRCHLPIPGLVRYAFTTGGFLPVPLGFLLALSLFGLSLPLAITPASCVNRLYLI